MKCMNWKAVAVLAAAVVAVAVLVPGTAPTVLPLLLFALCPLFMFGAMWLLARNGQTDPPSDELAQLRAEVAALRGRPDHEEI